jgi:hypothetical protein
MSPPIYKNRSACSIGVLRITAAIAFGGGRLAEIYIMRPATIVGLNGVQYLRIYHRCRNQCALLVRVNESSFSYVSWMTTKICCYRLLY